MGDTQQQNLLKGEDNQQQEQNLRVESADVSEIEQNPNPKGKKPLSNVEKIVDGFNKFRFKNHDIMHRLISVISDQSSVQNNNQVEKEGESQQQNQKSEQQQQEQQQQQKQQQNLEKKYSVIDRVNKTIYLSQIDRIIEYKDEEILFKLQTYLQNMDIFNQILPDFTFSQEFNTRFEKYYKNKFENNNNTNNQESNNNNENTNGEAQQVQNNNINTESGQNNNNNEQQQQIKKLKSQTSNNNLQEQQQKSTFSGISLFSNVNYNDQIQEFRDKFQSHFYYGYSLKNVDVEKLESYIILILIEEFILLNHLESQDQKSISSKNLTIDFDPTNPPEQLGFLNNLYNAICLNCVKNQENDSNFDVYILMMYSDAFQRCETPQKTGMRKTMDGRSVFFSTQGLDSQQQHYFSNGHKNREYLSVFPEKYSKLIKNTTQIPQKSIEVLVKQMDSDGDLRLTKEDIQKYAYSQYLHWSEETFANMFKEAASKRRITNPIQYEAPITVQEILGAVTLHQRLTEQKRWVEFERPFRKYWVDLLETVGEKIPYSHDLAPLKINPIKDLHQLQTESFKPKIPKSKSCINIKKLKKPQYLKPFRAEASIIINNTQNIKELVMEKETYDPNKVDAFEKIINQQFKTFDEKGNPSITFNTQNYYKEADRLAKNPSEYINAPKNPIYQYFPENFDFKSSNKDKDKGNQQLQSQLSQIPQQYNNNNNNQFVSQQSQLQKIQSMRGSQAFSPNQKGIENPQFFEGDSSQFIDDMEDQMDIDSLLKTQSVLKIGKQISKIPNEKQSQLLPSKYVQSMQTPSNILPVMSRIKLREQKMIQIQKQNIKDKLNNQNLQSQGVFTTTFKLENVPTLKQRLSQQEPVTDPYNPVSNFNFRQEVYIPDKRDKWRNRIKPDPLENPFGISIHDPRPQEALLRQERQKQREQEAYQRQLDEISGKKMDDKDWIKYFVLPDNQHQMVNNKRPEMFPKGQYTEPSGNSFNLLRGESKFSEPFKLFHRTLRTNDKNFELGQVPDSLF